MNNANKEVNDIKGKITKDVEKAEKQMMDKQKQIEYDMKDYTIELIVNKFKSDDFSIPSYQRQFVWGNKYRTAFI